MSRRVGTDVGGTKALGVLVDDATGSVLAEERRPTPRGEDSTGPLIDVLAELSTAVLEPRLGMVQARWGHLNRRQSVLTRLQGLLLDGLSEADRARLDFADGRAGVSLFKAEPRTLPLTLEMVERHPDGSQCFIPMSMDPFLVIVAPDAGGRPGGPVAFVTAPGQGVNYRRGTWHGVLTPLHAPGLFAVVDRIGAGANLEEHWFGTAFTIVR